MKINGFGESHLYIMLIYYTQIRLLRGALLVRKQIITLNRSQVGTILLQIRIFATSISFYVVDVIMYSHSIFIHIHIQIQ